MKKFLILGALLLSSGCAQQTFYVNGSEGTLAKESMDLFFVNGIGQDKATNAAQVCGGAERVVKVEAQSGPVDLIIGMVSGGIVTPRTSRVYCRR